MKRSLVVVVPAFSLLGACSLLWTGDGLVGPPPDAGSEANIGVDAIAPCTHQCADTFVEDQPNVYGVASDGVAIYWTTLDGAVRKRGVAGGSIELLADGEDEPRFIVVSSFDIYWTTRAGVRQRSRSGGGVTTIASASETPAGIAVDGETVYWSEPGAGRVRATTPAQPSPGVAYKDLDRPGELDFIRGAAFIPIATGDVVTYNLLGAPVVAATKLGATSVTAGDVVTYVYYASSTTNVVGRFHRSTSVVEILGRDAEQPASIAVVAGAIYWSEPAAGRIRRLVY